MSIRTIAVQLTVAAAVLGAGLTASAAPATAADTASTGITVVDADGTTRGSVTADPSLVNVCDWLADGVEVSVEYLFSDGQFSKRIAPLGGCTPAQAFGSPIVAVRGFAGGFANPWHPVV